MKLRILHIICMMQLFIAGQGFGQDVPDFYHADSLTYQLYQQEQWRQLIDTGEGIIDKGLDYHYLRMRIGIAYYSIEKYRRAAFHFQKAVELNSANETAWEYLFYSWLYAGNRNKAGFVLSRIPAKTRQKISDSKPFLKHEISAGTGLVISNNIAKNEKRNLYYPDKIFGSQDLNDDAIHWYGGINSVLGRMAATFFYSGMDMDKQYHVQVPELVVIDSMQQGYGKIYIYDTIDKNVSDRYRLLQNQFYGKVDVSFGNNISVSPAFHMLFVDYQSVTPTADTVQFYLQPSDFFQSVKTVYSFPEKTTSLTDYVISLKIAKELPVADIELITSYSGLNEKEQVQIGAGTALYPFGHSGFYSKTNLVWFNEEDESRIIFGQLIGGELFPNVWTEGYAVFGEQTNYNEHNGFSVFNTGDRLMGRIGANFFVSLSLRISLNIYYQGMFRKSRNLNYSDLNDYFYKENSYFNHSLTGGLTWRF